MTFHYAHGNGRAEEILTHEFPAIRVRSSSFNAFTIRGFVAGVRNVNISQCWPFSPQLLKERLQEGSKYLLPTLEIRMHRYWGCLNCVENITPSDGLVCQRDIDQEFDASNADTFPTNDPKGLLDRPLEKEEYFSDHKESIDLEAKSHGILKESGPEQEKVARNGFVDVRSDEAHSVSYEKVCSVEDEAPKDKALEHLTTQKLSLNLKGGEVNQSHIENVTGVCNLSSQLIEDELNFPVNNSSFVDEKNQVFADASIDQMAVEVYRTGSNVSENAKTLSHTSVAVDSLTKFRRVGWRCDGSQDDTVRENEMERIANESPVSNTFTSTIEDLVAKDSCPIQAVLDVETDHIIRNIMKPKARQHNEKGKTQKKRLITDLIAALPSDQIRWNARNHNCAQTGKLKAAFHRRKIAKNQRGSKDVTHNLKKLKGKRKYISDVHSASLQTNIPREKSPSEALEMKRKRQRLGVAAQSSPSTNSVEELRMEDERDIVQNSSERPQADHWARSSRKKVLIQEVNQDEAKTPTQLESDEVLLDLMNFISQNRSEQHPSLRSAGNNPAHVVTENVEQLGDQLRLQSNSSSRQKFIGGQSASKCIPHEVVSESGQMYLVVEQGHQRINKMDESLTPQKLDVVGLAKKTGAISETRDKTFLDSRQYSNIITKTNKKSLNHRGRSLTIQEKNSAAQKSIKKSSPSSHQALLSEQDAFRRITAEVLSKDAQMYLMSEKMDVSERVEKTLTSSEIQNTICQGSRDYPDIITKTGENNLDHRGKLITSVALTGQRKGTKRRKSAIQKSVGGSNLSLREDLTEEEEDFRCIAFDIVSKDGQAYPVAKGRLQHINPGYSTAEKFDVLGKPEQIGIVSDSGVVLVSGSKDCSDIITRFDERNLDHGRERVSQCAMKAQKDKQSHKKRSAARKSRKESNSSPKKGKEYDPACRVTEVEHIQSIQVTETVMPHKLEALGLTTEKRANFEMQGRITLGSRGCLDTVSSANLKRMVRGGELISAVVMKGQKEKESNKSKSKKSADLKSTEKSGLSLKEGLAHIPAENVVLDDHMDLVAGRGNQQMNQVRQENLEKQEKLDILGKSAKAGASPETWNRVVLGSRDCSDIMTRIGEEKSGFRGNLFNYAASKGQENKSFSTCERKRSDAFDSSKQSSLYSNQSLVGEQDPLRCIPSEVDLENGHVVLVPIKNQQTNKIRHSFIPDNLQVSEQAMEADTNSEKGDGVVSGSRRHCLDILTRTGSEGMVNRDKLTRYVVEKRQMSSGPCNPRGKKASARKSVKECKAVAKGSRNHVTIIKETNAALNAALANAKAGRLAFGDTITQGHSNCWDQRLHSSLSKSMALESLQTTVRGGFSSAQKLLETVASPTSKIKEQFLVDNCCTCLTLNSQGLLPVSSSTHDKNLELKISYPKDNYLHQQMNCSKLASPALAPATVYNSQIGMPLPALIDKNFTFPGGTGDAGKTEMNQIALKYGTSWVQSPCHDDNVSVLRTLAMQSSRSATCLPVKDFIGANELQYLPSSNGSCTSSGCILPCVTFTTPAMKSSSDWVEYNNESMPLMSSPAFSIAQGNNTVIPTALSEETFSRNKYDLQSYIQERIEAYRPSWASRSGDPRRITANMAEKSARKLSKVHETSSGEFCNPHGNPKTDVGSLEFCVPSQKPAEMMKNNGEMSTTEGIQRTMYSKSERVLTVNQALQPEIFPFAPADLYTRTKDFTSKQTVQSKTFKPTHGLDTKDLTIDLASDTSQHQKFGKKQAMMVMNARNIVQSGHQELESSRLRITAMSGSGGSANYKHVLKPPVAYNTELCLPIHSTFHSTQTPMPEQYFHGVHETNTDKHGRILSPLDKSFTMKEKQFLSYSHVGGNMLFGIKADSSTSENAGGIYSGKVVYSNPDKMAFVRSALRDETFLFHGKIVGESLAKTGNKGDPDSRSHCKDASLGLSLSNTHGGPEKKHENEKSGQVKHNDGQPITGRACCLTI